MGSYTIRTSNKIDITNAVTDSNGILTLTLTSAAKTKFLQLYPDTTGTSASSEAHIKIGGTLPNVLKSAKDKTMRVHGLTGSSTNLAISNYRFTPNQSNLHTNITIITLTKMSLMCYLYHNFGQLELAIVRLACLNVIFV